MDKKEYKAKLAGMTQEEAAIEMNARAAFIKNLEEIVRTERQLYEMAAEAAGY